ncbi:endonuclease/exonuclease/phosphatase family protein [Dysgonomonas massiliensis]|uniref:endonuclease/exonuclease/phosphatase family protein n=1 Tax=Dysgonomonas massiliensis TaxID=2040292 RepID=UPI000C786898|nr:endonuclease/exonuclease/phosphatase family protein [Dysgonomonas massiliensis]
MKRLIFNILILTTIIIMQSCSNKPLELNVMTFNIRLDAESDSLNNWKYRKDVAAQIIKNYDADIIGAQEVCPNQMQDLKDRLPEYAAIGVGREDGTNGPNSGESSPLFYKKDKFKELKSGTFWLSETPDVPSMGWDAACRRVATWAVLEDIASGKKFFTVNTHLDHVGQEARIKGVTLMLEKAIEEAEGYPVILTGDFNSTPTSDVVKYIIDESTPHSLADSRSLAKNKIDKAGTFHNFGKLSSDQQEYIDYIFVSKGTEVDKYEVIDDKLDGIFLSDHNPVFAKIIVH